MILKDEKRVEGLDDIIDELHERNVLLPRDLLFDKFMTCKYHGGCKCRLISNSMVI